MFCCVIDPTARREANEYTFGSTKREKSSYLMCDGVLVRSCLKQDVAVLGQGFLCTDGKTVQVAKRTHWDALPEESSNGGHYGTYLLDDQATAKKYEGQRVVVTGTLDATRNTIHVRKIEAVA